MSEAGRISPRRCLSRRHRAHDRRVVACMAAAAARPQRRAERRVRRARRRRLRAAVRVRRAGRHAEHRPRRGQRPALREHAHDGAVLADALVHPDRAQPPLQRRGGDHGDATGFPGYDGRMPFANGMLPEMLLESGYNTFCVGKWHLSPSEESTPAGPVPPLAAGPRVRALLRLPRRRDQPVVPRPHVRQPLGASAEDRRGGLPPQRGPHRQGDPVHLRRARQRAGQAVLPLPRPRRGARAAPGRQGVDRRSTAASSTWAGTRYREKVFASQKRARHPAGRRRAVSARPGRPRVGHAARRRAATLRALHGGLRRLPRARRPSHRARSSTPSRRSASSTTRSSWSSPTTARAPRAASPARSTR